MESILNLREIEYFVTVADELHFSRAAERLRVSQPGLSRAIRTLELKLGVPLFTRSSREVTLTEAGLLLVPDARRVMAEVSRLQAQARLISVGDLGDLSIGYIPMIQRTAENLIASFTAAHPDIVLHHRREYQVGLLNELNDSSSGLDVAVLLGPTPGEDHDSLGLSSIPFRELELYCVVSPNHPIAQRTEIQFAELGDFPIVAYSSPGGRLLIDILRPRFEEEGVNLEVGTVLDPVLTTAAIFANDQTLVWLQTKEFPQIEGLSRVQIEPPLDCPFQLVYRSDNNKPSLGQFLEAARLAEEGFEQAAAD